MVAERRTTFPTELRQWQIFRSTPMTAESKGSTALAAEIRAFWIFNATALAAHFTSLIAKRASKGVSEHQHNRFSDRGSTDCMYDFAGLLDLNLRSQEAGFFTLHRAILGHSVK